MSDAPDYTLIADVEVIGSVTIDVNVLNQDISEKLFTNPRFEKGTIGWDWWGDANLEVTDQDPYEGNYSARLYSSAAGATVTAVTHDSVPVEGGELIMIGAAVKCGATANAVRIAISWYDSTGAWIGNTESDNYTAANWGKLFVRGSPPSNAAYWKITLIVESKAGELGEGFFDQISVFSSSYVNVNLNAQAVDLTIINPSGVPLYTGESGITGSVSDAFSPPAGGEYTVVSLTGRGRIHAIGWVNWGSATYDSLRLRIYKKNEDGSFTKVVDLRAKDFDILNGFHISSEFAFAGVSSGYRRASALSRAGGMTFFDNEGSYEGPYGCVLTIPFDFKYGAEVRIYNPLSYEPAQSVVVLYGTYET